jgi:uncharacterized damage-inducible protein DinB
MNIQEAIRSTQQSLEQIISASQELSSEALNWKPAEDKWSVMEVLVHVDEAIPYWLDELNNLLEKPGTEWGRGLQDERRLAALAAVGSRSLEEVIDSIKRAKEQVAIVLGPITDDELMQESPSRNPRFGTKPLSFVIQHLLVDHAASHVRQIARNIEQYQAQK